MNKQILQEPALKQRAHCIIDSESIQSCVNVTSITVLLVKYHLDIEEAMVQKI